MEVVDLLRKTPGVTVHSTSQVGVGFPDIVVGYRGHNYLFEIKDPQARPSDQSLTMAQRSFFELWRGQVTKVTETAQILRAIGAIPQENHDAYDNPVRGSHIEA